MSRKIQNKMTEHEAVEYWGGDEKGMCLQIQSSDPVKVKDTPVDQSESQS